MPRAWVIHDYTGYKNFSLEEFAQETPGPGEIRLRIEAFALNWGDMDLMFDRYSFSFSQFPARIGMEATGIVDMIGPEVTDIELGQRYCTLPHFYDIQGTSAESAIVDARYVTKAPEGLSAVESASIWMQNLTAYFPIVEISDARPGKNILITAATGTAGSAAIEIGKLCGATMIGTTRFDYNQSYLKQIGTDHVFVAGSGNLDDYLMEVTDGKGVDAVFDPVGAGMINQYSGALARDARIYFYGTLDEHLPELPLMEMLQANAVFHPYSLFNFVENPEMLTKGKAFVYQALAAESILPRIDKVYPMEEYREAWEYMKAPRKTHGKIVIETGL